MRQHDNRLKRRTFLAALLHKCEQEVKAIADDETFQNYENNFDNLNDKKREREVVDQF